MFLSNPARNFLAASFIFILTAGCGWLPNSETTDVRSVAEPKSRYPFEAKEPENFQCEIVETAGATVRRVRVVRKGMRRRTDYDLGASTERTILRTDREYIIDRARGVYAEKPTPAGTPGEKRFTDLTHELLTGFKRSTFEEFGREGSLVKYKVVSEGSLNSETILYYDPAIGMPVKRESFSIQGAERRLQHTVELVNISLEPDERLFTLPPGLRKVSPADLNKPK